MSKKKHEKDETVSTGGGAYIGGNVNTGGGDFVGRDKKISAGERGVAIGGNVSGSAIVTGDGNTVNLGELRQVFAPVYRAIEQSSRSASAKADLRADVQEIEAAARQPQPDEGWLGRRLRNLKHMAPDIAEVLLSALISPQAVVAETVKKIAARVHHESLSS